MQRGGLRQWPRLLHLLEIVYPQARPAIKGTSRGLNGYFLLHLITPLSLCILWLDYIICPWASFLSYSQMMGTITLLVHGYIANKTHFYSENHSCGFVMLLEPWICSNYKMLSHLFWNLTIERFRPTVAKILSRATYPGAPSYGGVRT